MTQMDLAVIVLSVIWQTPKDKYTCYVYSCVETNGEKKGGCEKSEEAMGTH